MKTYHLNISDSLYNTMVSAARKEREPMTYWGLRGTNVKARKIPIIVKNHVILIPPLYNKASELLCVMMPITENSLSYDMKAELAGQILRGFLTPEELGILEKNDAYRSIRLCLVHRCSVMRAGNIRKTLAQMGLDFSLTQSEVIPAVDTQMAALLRASGLMDAIKDKVVEKVEVLPVVIKARDILDSITRTLEFPKILVASAKKFSVFKGLAGLAVSAAIHAVVQTVEDHSGRETAVVWEDLRPNLAQELESRPHSLRVVVALAAAAYRALPSHINFGSEQSASHMAVQDSILLKRFLNTLYENSKRDKPDRGVNTPKGQTLDQATITSTNTVALRTKTK